MADGYIVIRYPDGLERSILLLNLSPLPLAPKFKVGGTVTEVGGVKVKRRGTGAHGR